LDSESRGGYDVVTEDDMAAVVVFELAQTCAGGSLVDVATARCDAVRVAHERSRRVDATTDDRSA
jgi:hypothetical protein